MTELLNNVSRPGTVNNVPTGVSSTANDQAQVTIDHSDRNKDISSCTNPFINPSSSSCFSDSTSGENHVDPVDLTYVFWPFWQKHTGFYNEVSGL